MIYSVVWLDSTFLKSSIVFNSNGTFGDRFEKYDLYSGFNKHICKGNSLQGSKLTIVIAVCNVAFTPCLFVFGTWFLTNVLIVGCCPIYVIILLY